MGNQDDVEFIDRGVEQSMKTRFGLHTHIAEITLLSAVVSALVEEAFLNLEQDATAFAKTIIHHLRSERRRPVQSRFLGISRCCRVIGSTPSSFPSYDCELSDVSELLSVVS